MDASLGAQLARLSLWGVSTVYFLVWPLGILYALWRMRRGIAGAGVTGFVVRLAGGVAVVAAVAIIAMFGLAPGVQQLIADCQVNEQPGDFCEDEGIVVAFPLVFAVFYAPAWAIGVVAVKAGALLRRPLGRVWRRWMRTSVR